MITVNLIFCLSALVLSTIGYRLIRRGRTFSRHGGDAYNKRQVRRTLGLMLWVVSATLVVLALVNAIYSLGPAMTGVAQSGGEGGGGAITGHASSSPAKGPGLINVPALHLDAASAGSSGPKLVSVPSPEDLTSAGRPASPTLLHPLPAASADAKPAGGGGFNTSADFDSAMASSFHSPSGPAPAAAAQEVAPPPREAAPALDAAKLKELDDNLAEVNAILQKDPANVVAYIRRGNVYGNERKWDLARKDYQHALELDGKCVPAAFNLAELEFMQGKYDAARPGFVALQQDIGVGDLSKYNVFLCDLFGGHDAAAAKELDAFNQVGSDASYYYANVAWSYYHKQDDQATDWLQSAHRVFSQDKCGLYEKPLKDLGYITDTASS